MIPVANLKPAIESTRPEWERHLTALYARGHYILGEQVEAFEHAFAEATGAGFTVGVGSGSGAIEISLRALGITQSEQEVLTSALTAPFTAVAVLAAGASVSFADVDPETLQMDPEDAAYRVRPRTAALLPVHLYGQLCKIYRFTELARTQRLTLVQDACQAHGARYDGTPLSQISQCVAYSFYPTKNLGCLGDGGAIATDDPQLAETLRALRDGGRVRSEQVSRTAGINSRLDEMQCCYLRAFLPRLSEWNAHRASIAALYDEGLRECPGVQIVKRDEMSVNHLYVIRASRRDQLREHLAAREVGTAVHYPVPLHLHPAFSGCGLKRGDLPVAERACEEILSLPLWPYLPREDACRVVDSVLAFYR
ncbi:MAG TPA: DegT/DnrJ/EryC1/StrS family aminotransferase [Bryobacteraceae bacterium]|nr:DegT/DnrJ/EryC1/StrS family aminotransferase [Bryobacteraceae bacterium]